MNMVLHSLYSVSWVVVSHCSLVKKLKINHTRKEWKRVLGSKVSSMAWTTMSLRTKHTLKEEGKREYFHVLDIA